MADASMTDTSRLKTIIENSGLKYNYIAKQMGLTYFGLSQKINNKTEFKASEINLLCKVLNINSLKLKEEIFFAYECDLKSSNDSEVAT